VAEAVRTVLHINVRLERGGAARIARNLATQLSGRGYGGQLVYGYGPRAGTSPEEESTGALRLTSRPRAGANAAVHKVTGREVVRPARARMEQLHRSAVHSDVVHLHVLHSFLGPARPLVESMIATGRPVVWTLHDSWTITGRCAITGGCRRWVVGCGSCPDRSAYPGALLDLTRSGARRRRGWISALDGVTFVAPSEHTAADFRAAYPGHRVRCIHNGADPEFSRPPDALTPLQQRRGFALVAEDLSDPQKVPPRVVSSLLTAGVPLVMIGRHCPYEGPLVTDVGPLTGRRRLAEVLGRCQALLFLSQIDVFSLTVLEALVGGVPVLALDSAGAREALSPLGIETMTESSLVTAARDGGEWAGHPHRDPVELAAAASTLYSTQAMAGRYADLYDELLGTSAQ